jgi:subtilisin family serine protease
MMDHRHLISRCSVVDSSSDWAADAKAVLRMVRLDVLMARTAGRTDVAIGLLDGPVDTSHSSLSTAHIRAATGGAAQACVRSADVACGHGTAVAGTLLAGRHTQMPGICPESLLVVIPIFEEAASEPDAIPEATPALLASAIVDAIASGVRVVNISAAIRWPTFAGERDIVAALDHAARHGVLVVAAAGNDPTTTGSSLTRHPWAIPVTASDHHARPMPNLTVGASIGRRGVSAPGSLVLRPGPGDTWVPFGGTSAAAPLVTGTIALLWALFPDASAAEIRWAVTAARPSDRRRVVPPLLDAQRAYGRMAMRYAERRATALT